MSEAWMRPWSSRLAIRFAIILAVALLPAGIIAFVQTHALEREIRERSNTALIGSTLQAAAEETALISRVRGMAGSLAGAVPAVIDNPAACKALMARIAATEPMIRVAAFIPLSGRMTCAFPDTEHDFTGDPQFEAIAAARAPFFIVNPVGPISRVSILGISHPVFDDQGRYIGYAGMSIAHETMRELAFTAFLERSRLAEPVLYWTFDKSGTVLSSNRAMTEAQLRMPALRPLSEFVGTQGEVFEGTGVDGQVATYAVAPIVAGELYLMSSFLPGARSLASGYNLGAYVPTLLMWLAGLVTSGVAADLLVTRHIRTLHRSIVAFTRGDRRLQAIEMRSAPVEIEELADAYMAMTDSVTRSEAELEDSIHQKEVLLREVHHRVKNNLQLISSIMNIQLRSAQSGETRDMLKNLQERIMSLATVHRGLYQTSGLADVRARELIPDIVRQIMAISAGPEKPFDIRTDIDDLRLVPDQAVPLSLLLAEALTNAQKHSGARRGRPGTLEVRLKRSGGSDAVLEVVNSHVPDPDATTTGWGSGIGLQLISAFVQQLAGRQEFEETPQTYTLRVTFSVAPLAEAENRRMPPPADDVEWNGSAS